MSIKNFIQRLIKERFRITFFHDDFKPVFSLRFTIFTLILWLVGFSTLIIAITTFIIAKTSLKEYIPGSETTDEKKQIIQLVKRIDSLEKSINNKNLILQSVLKIFHDAKDSIPPPPKLTNNSNSNKNLKASSSELSVRNEIEKEISQQPAMIKVNQYPENFQFFSPANGVVISKYEPQQGHFGIDIVGKKDAPVRSIAKGIIVYSTYSADDGNIVVIAHSEAWISVYKHLSMIIKSVGSVVSANEVIGTMGNTGHSSTGYHLHFELWYNQTPKNPLDFIVL